MRTKIQAVSLDKVLPLRQKLLRPYLSVNACRFPSDDHAFATHFGAIANKKLMGICSIAPEAFPLQPWLNGWRLRMMAVDECLRGTGVGTQLLQMAEQHAQLASADCLWCNARMSAQGFYQKQNYAVVGEAFDIENIGPHYPMIKHFHLN